MKNFFNRIKRYMTLPERWDDKTRLFLIWGVLCLLANLFCTEANAFGGDQNYWVDWVKKLASGGFEKFDGNYPPLYVFWLWVVSKVYVLTEIPVDRTFMLKFVCLWPVFFVHLGLVDIVSRFVVKSRLQPVMANLVMAFVALNPALLLDGPVWGQVDLFPCIFGIAALYCVNFKHKMKYAAMFFALAVLAKFQMILLLPVFGGIFLRQYKISWRGFPAMIVAVLLVFLPFIVSGNLGGMLSHAYVNTTSQYPFATYNAANLWMLTVGNLSRDATPFFDLSADGIGFLLSPSRVGKILFVIVSVYILKCSLFAKSLRRTFELATLSAFAFFVLLPGMHERYLAYAVPFACVWMALDLKKSWFWAVVITALCATNIEVVNGLSGANLWPWISSAAVLAFVFAIIHSLFPKFFPYLGCAIQKVRIPRVAPYVILAVILAVELGCEIKDSWPIAVKLLPNQMYLTDLPIERFTQEYGKPRINRSVEGKKLAVKGRAFENGIGSHAASNIRFKLPDDAETLEFMVGVDDEVSGGGSVKFRITSSDEVLWSSEVVRGNQTPVVGKVNVSGRKSINLEMDANGDNAYDHADWLNLILTKKK